MWHTYIPHSLTHSLAHWPNISVAPTKRYFFYKKITQKSLYYLNTSEVLRWAFMWKHDIFTCVIFISLFREMKLIWTAGRQMKWRCDHRSCNHNVSNLLQILAQKEKIQIFNRIVTHGLCISASVLYQLSYEDPDVGSRPVYCMSSYLPMTWVRREMKLIWTVGIYMNWWCDHRKCNCNLSNCHSLSVF